MRLSAPGDYRQSRKRLRRTDRDDSFDALGVACDVLAPENWKLSTDPWSHWSHDGETYTLSPTMLSLLGLTQWDARRLATMNDEDDYSFAELADYIDAY